MYYLLQIKGVFSEEPQVFTHTSRNYTEREGLARKIFNNQDRKLSQLYGKFNPDKDFLLPVDGSIANTFGMFRSSLDEEEE